MPCLVLGFFQSLFNDGLGSNSGVIRSRHPKGGESLHPMHTNLDILKRVVQRMSQVQCARNIRRGDHDRKWFFGWIHVRVEAALFQPLLVDLGGSRSEIKSVGNFFGFWVQRESNFRR